VIAKDLKLGIIDIKIEMKKITIYFNPKSNNKMEMMNFNLQTNKVSINNNFITNKYEQSSSRF